MVRECYLQEVREAEEVVEREGSEDPLVSTCFSQLFFICPIEIGIIREKL